MCRHRCRCYPACSLSLYDRHDSRVREANTNNNNKTKVKLQDFGNERKREREWEQSWNHNHHSRPHGLSFTGNNRKRCIHTLLWNDSKNARECKGQNDWNKAYDEHYDFIRLLVIFIFKLSYQNQVNKRQPSQQKDAMLNEVEQTLPVSATQYVSFGSLYACADCICVHSFHVLFFGSLYHIISS